MTACESRTPGELFSLARSTQSTVADVLTHARSAFDREDREDRAAAIALVEQSLGSEASDRAQSLVDSLIPIIRAARLEHGPSRFHATSPAADRAVLDGARALGLDVADPSDRLAAFAACDDIFPLDETGECFADHVTPGEVEAMASRLAPIMRTARIKHGPSRFHVSWDADRWIEEAMRREGIVARPPRVGPPRQTNERPESHEPASATIRGEMTNHKERKATSKS